MNTTITMPMWVIVIIVGLLLFLFLRDDIIPAIKRKRNAYIYARRNRFTAKEVNEYIDNLWAHIEELSKDAYELN
jgi:hypothetical protein